MEDLKKAAFHKKVSEEPFAKLLNITLKDVKEGYAVCEMEYTEQMDNIYGSAHGGAIFSLIDEAFEISSNRWHHCRGPEYQCDVHENTEKKYSFEGRV
ncbi:MAG: PaaI family thioesterase, partial [Deltaproteobacteria bacterium]|nr:PaaI family thioesterase [Deltaproteobacteria bacterium]